IPDDKWLASTSAAAGPGPQMYAQICSGRVSIVVLRTTNGKFDNPNDEVIAPLVRRLFSKKTVAGRGGHRTTVYALTGSAKSMPSCGAQTNVGYDRRRLRHADTGRSACGRSADRG